MEKPRRLFFVDNLRTFMIILVFLQHLVLTYGGSGLWYYQEGQLTPPQSYVALAFTCVNQAFFMGLLFLLAGYFTPSSYERKGAGHFFLDRLTRLWLPVGIFIFLIDPFMQYALVAYDVMPSPTGMPITLQDLPSLFINPFNGLGFGPLWFVEALFYFTIVYTLFRMVFKKPGKIQQMPKNAAIMLFALALGAISFLVRIYLPIGFVLNPWGFQLPFFPQYIALFIVGIIAFRGNWFLVLPAETGKLWLRVAALLLIVWLCALAYAAVTNTVGSFFGGLNLGTAFYAFWEQSFAIAVSIGLTYLFRERLNFQGHLLKLLSDNSYAAYVLQAPILVGLSLSLATLKMPLAMKFFVVAPIGVFLCFAVSYLCRKLPYVDRVF